VNLSELEIGGGGGGVAIDSYFLISFFNRSIFPELLQARPDFSKINFWGTV